MSKIEKDFQPEGGHEQRLGYGKLEGRFGKGEQTLWVE